jgi:hypothetical protein
MEKTQEILKHMFDLYNETEYTEEETINWCEKNIERYNAWQEAFKDFDLLDVFHAIDHYWRYNSNKTKPTVAKILAILETNNAKRIEETQVQQVKYFNPAVEYMQRDINLGKCRHTIKAYDRAVDYIINELLLDEVPVQEHGKMDFTTKVANAKNKGLFANFDDILEQLATTGTVQPKAVDSFNSAGAILAGHWGLD